MNELIGRLQAVIREIMLRLVVAGERGPFSQQAMALREVSLGAQSSQAARLLPPKANLLPYMLPALNVHFRNNKDTASSSSSSFQPPF